MAIVISRNSDGTASVVDRTEAIQLIPNVVGITNALGLFQDDPRSQKNIEIVRTSRKNAILEDRNWDERNQTIRGNESDSLLLKIPHFPLDDAITPNDIDGIVRVDNDLAATAELEAVASTRAEKLVNLRESHDLTLEVARMRLITTGKAYAPRGTVVTDYYTEFGITREEIEISLAASTDPRAKVSEAKKASRSGLMAGQAGTIRSFVALCSESFYNALIQNAYVTDALKHVDQTQALQVLLGNGGGAVGGLDARFESVSLFGVTWINAGAAGYEDADGVFQLAIPEGDAYMMPVGVRNMFKTYYAPANRFASVNKTAQTSYYFEYLNQKDDKIEMMTERNFLNALLAPGAVVRLHLDI